MDEIGARFEAECADMNEMGAGILRHGGMVVFVPGLVTGERAEIGIRRVEKNYAVGECLRLISRSPNRIESICPSESECGGCCLGHVTYEAENEIKRNAVRAAFRRQGLRAPDGDWIPVEPTLSGPDRYGYRNKISLRYDPEARRFGYSRPESNEILPFRGCPLCPPRFSEIVCFLNENPTLTAPLQPESLRIRSASDGLSASFSLESGSEDERKAFADTIRAEFPDLRVLFGGEEAGGGHAAITDRAAGLELRFSAEAFRQVNTPVFDLLLGIVKEMAGEVPFSRAADLYCGSGTVGLALASAFPSARFTGIEINPDAVSDAKKNAARNGLGNIRFFAGDASTFRRRIRPEESPELVTVDPPRAGLSASVRRDLCALAPERIVYISCNPQTLARDAADFAQNGYAVRRIVPVNMFPATRHVETVCCLYHQKKDFISLPYEPKNASYMKTMQ